MKHRSEDPAVDKSAKALPCPWCGSLKLRVCFTEDEGVHRSTWVYCAGCAASGPTADGEIDAVARWNVRILSLAPKPPGNNPYLKCLLIFTLFAFLCGCAPLPGSPERVDLVIENKTSEPVYGFLVSGSPLFMPSISLKPGEARSWWMLREYIPGRIKLVIVERKEDK